MKRWYASKTVWANVVAFAASITAAFGLDLGLNPAVQAQIVGGVMAVVNIILRFMTDSPIK